MQPTPLLRAITLLLTIQTIGTAATLPSEDQRGTPARTLNTPRKFVPVADRQGWTQTANAIRDNVLVSCGLWPLPRRQPMKTEIFGRVERGDYSVEKVVFQPVPGFYLGGNLYRPLGKGNGPFPAILNPHGHWQNGRMADSAAGSIAARCINQAKQGMVAFSYDMTGYNDTIQVSHQFASDPTNQLWSISLMGIQTWNSIRALDFLESLPEVDATRLACTGESGGGTQTFMLGAVDKRLAVQAPIVMVSHTMQGGCLCENAPGLRVDYSNMEIAAVPAPRPQILVAATGDWTRATMTVEGPALGRIYELLGAKERLRYVIHQYDHNYNKESREDVYGWFAKYLNHRDSSAPVPEADYTKEPDIELRVYPNGKLPTDALNEPKLIQSLITAADKRLESLAPTNAATLQTLQKVLVTGWRHILHLDIPSAASLIEQKGKPAKSAGVMITPVSIGREGRGDHVKAIQFSPEGKVSKRTVVLVSIEGSRAFVDASGQPTGLARAFVSHGNSVIAVDLFRTGPAAPPQPNQLGSYFTTYNRTLAQERVQDLVTVCAYAVRAGGGSKVVLAGVGNAGIYCLLAAPAADAVIADCAGVDPMDDNAMLSPDLFVPGIRRMKSFEGPVALAAPNPVYLHGAGEKFSTAFMRSAYVAAGKAASLQTQAETASMDQQADWIDKL